MRKIRAKKVKKELIDKGMCTKKTYRHAKKRYSKKRDINTH